MARKDRIGRLGEEIAEEHLEQEGYCVLERRWRCEHGELDLVALDGDEAVIVEVKTRSGTAFGHPLEAVTPTKLARLRRLATIWNTSQEEPMRRLRIDVVGVLVDLESGGASVDHVKAVG